MKRVGNEWQVFTREGVIYVLLNGQEYSAEAFESEFDLVPPAVLEKIQSRIDLLRDTL